MLLFNKPQTAYTAYSLSEKAVTIAFGNTIAEDILEKVNRLNHLVNSNPFPGFETTVPAYTTLTIFFDPLQVIKTSGLTGNTCFERISNYVYQLEQKPKEKLNKSHNTVTIPVCYGGYFGPDLVEVAERNNLSVKEVIRIHSSTTYKVYMLGFVPGFAYMGGMSDKIAAPRKAVPRSLIPAGSVGIAGAQTGIYPLETPGGWQLIGRTPLTLFDAANSHPSLLKAGDQIIFKPISESQFNTYHS